MTGVRKMTETCDVGQVNQVSWVNPLWVWLQGVLTELLKESKGSFLLLMQYANRKWYEDYLIELLDHTRQ